MKKRLFVLCLAVCFLLSAVPVFADMGENLVKNGDFSALDDGGLPLEWTYRAWEEDESVSTYWTEDKDGDYCVRLENFEYNDAYLTQEVKVRGNTLYHISAKVRAENCDPDAICANLSVLDTFALSGDWADTSGGWETVDLYGKTTLLQSSITVALRLGFYGDLNCGSAWFDDVVVEQVDAAPAGYEIHTFKTEKANAGTTNEQGEGANWIPTQIFLSCLFVLVLLYLLLRVRSLPFKEKTVQTLLWVLLAAAFVLRVILALKNPGYQVDIGCFTGWGQMVLQYGFADFYEQGFCDYPPGYLYVLGGQALFASLLGIPTGSAAYGLIIKLIPMLCDLASSYLLYTIGKKQGKPLYGLIAATAYAFAPAVLVDSAMWGQMDSVLVLLMLLVICFFLEKKPLWAAIFYGIAVTVKPQALMLGTVMLCGYVLEIMDAPKQGFKKLFAGIGVCIAVMAVICVPFLAHQPVTYILEKYFSTVTSYPYATVNAMNLFYLFGGNWLAQESTKLGLSYAAWGTIGIALSVIGGCALCFASREKRSIPLTAALTLAGVFFLGCRMHERYMFPILGLLLLAALLYHDKRLWALFGGFSVTNAVNIYVVLQNEHILDSNRGVAVAVGLLNLILLLFFTETAVELCLKKMPDPMGNMSSRLLRRQVLPARLPDACAPGDRRAFRLTRVDYLLMAALTLVYSVFAFYQLGETKAPQTYREGVTGEEFVLDFGEERFVSRFQYYGEIAFGDFTVSFSRDGEQFSDEYSETMSTYDMFKWEGEDNVNVPARYAKLSVTSGAVRLIEVAFRDEEDNILPVSSTSAPELTDEQALVPKESSYLNSMYFDESYHGRTAYEQLHNMEWYENTHPPLGKMLMSWSISLFGMTPFAWRFAGTLAGVLMVPVMYLLCKLLFRKEWLSFLGTFLFTFDFMHLAQTRLATIDSYPVLFILLEFYFMLRYAYHSFYHEKLWKTFVPLFFSGIFMGLGMAAKWIGIYAGFGLAVLFFCILGMRFAEFRQARKDMENAEISKEKQAQARRITEMFPKKALWTLASCLVFFVAIPLLIYVGSYYQFLRIDAPNHGLREVWSYQTHMLNYHKGVFSEHPFSSSWYQWPLDIRNIWYYDGKNADGTISTITALGNPLIWWGGLASLIWIIVRFLRGYGRKDRRYVFLLLGFATNYLPWVLVPRVTFVYHYFASVPFIILCICMVFEDFYDKKWWKTACVLFMAVVFAMFIAYYPVLTGLPIPLSYAKLLEFMPSWTFC